MPTVRAVSSASRLPSKVAARPSQRPVSLTLRTSSAMALSVSMVPRCASGGTGSRSCSFGGSRWQYDRAAAEVVEVGQPRLPAR